MEVLLLILFSPARRRCCLVPRAPWLMMLVKGACGLMALLARVSVCPLWLRAVQFARVFLFGCRGHRLGPGRRSEVVQHD